MIKFNHDDIKYLATELPYSVNYSKHNGDWFGEISEIDRLLAEEIPYALLARLKIERVIAETMSGDYRQDFDDLLSRVSEKYPAVGSDELIEIIRMGQVDYIKKGGFSKLYFQNDAAANIFKCHKDYLERISNPDAESESESDRISRESIEIMRRQGGRAFRFAVEETIAPSPRAERQGEKIRVHLPYPAPCQTQPEGEIALISSSHKEVYISKGAQRTAFIENVHRAGEVYSVAFSYVNRAMYVEPNPDATLAEQPGFSTEELYPHIRFTPLVRALAGEIAGSETNRLLLARRVYDWVTVNIKYSYMREYLCIDNIPEFAILNGRGDCGVMALTFITLCRCLGIPAEWESGSRMTPSGIGSHDWARFYVAPYGWLYCDPSFGGGALRRGARDIWNHYFCNIDPFRLVANTDFQKSFDPPKQYMRTDPYDNQSGEAEYEGYGLGFGEVVKTRRVISAEELAI